MKLLLDILDGLPAEMLLHDVGAGRTLSVADLLLEQRVLPDTDDYQLAVQAGRHAIIRFLPDGTLEAAPAYREVAC
ncbi:MAG TPA: hypothetical protein VKN99_09555 [Polyangia bacterium]|nr:hypothetical protein [Polyangia bacterium]